MANHPAVGPIVLVVMGVSGVGKTTVGVAVATRLGWEFADADDYHSPANVEKMRSGRPLDDDDRQPWLEALHALAQDRLRQGSSLVLACSALKQKYRATIAGGDPRVRFVYLKGSFELLRERLAARHGHYMPAELLQSQFDALEEPADAFVVDVAMTPTAAADAVTAWLHDHGAH